MSNYNPSSGVKDFADYANKRRRGTNKERGYDEHWNRISRMKRQQNPLCEICNDSPSTEVHHVIPFDGPADPLRTDWNNLKAVCQDCHHKQHGRG